MTTAAKLQIIREAEARNDDRCREHARKQQGEG